MKELNTYIVEKLKLDNSSSLRDTIDKFFKLSGLKRDAWPKVDELVKKWMKNWKVDSLDAYTDEDTFNTLWGEFNRDLESEFNIDNRESERLIQKIEKNVEDKFEDEETGIIVISSPYGIVFKDPAELDNDKKGIVFVDPDFEEKYPYGPLG